MSSSPQCPHHNILLAQYPPHANVLTVISSRQYPPHLHVLHRSTYTRRKFRNMYNSIMKANSPSKRHGGSVYKPVQPQHALYQGTATPQHLHGGGGQLIGNSHLLGVSLNRWGWTQHLVGQRIAAGRAGGSCWWGKGQQVAEQRTSAGGVQRVASSRTGRIICLGKGQQVVEQ